MSPLHPVENFFILSAMGNLSLDTSTGCASPVPRHGYRPGGVVHPGRRHYGLMPRRCDTAWPVPMPRVQATGEDLDKISSKSHPMMMMVMCGHTRTVVSRCVSCVTCPLSARVPSPGHRIKIAASAAIAESCSRTRTNLPVEA